MDAASNLLLLENYFIIKEERITTAVKGTIKTTATIGAINIDIKTTWTYVVQVTRVLKTLLIFYL